jgi:hypothetical protein
MRHGPCEGQPQTLKHTDATIPDVQGLASDVEHEFGQETLAPVTFSPPTPLGELETLVGILGEQSENADGNAELHRKGPSDATLPTR